MRAVRHDESPRRARPVAELPERVIDVMVFGGSRPALLDACLRTFREHVRFSGTLRLLYQDCGYHAERAHECLDIVGRFGGFDAARIQAPVPDRPGVMSYGYSITAAFDDLVRAPLMFHLEDDHEFLRDVDLDVAWDLFAEHPINQLRYNRRKTPREENDGVVKVIERTFRAGGRDVVVTSSKNWYFQPAIWRMAFVRPRWLGHFADVHHHAQVDMIGTAKRPPPEWFIEKLGAVTMGAIGEPPFLRHTGTAEHSLHHALGRV